MSALAAYPDPVVFCETADGSVRVTAVNDSFHDYFEADPAGERLSAWLDRVFETGDTTVEEVVTALRDTGRVRPIRRSGRRLRRPTSSGFVSCGKPAASTRARRSCSHPSGR